MERYQRDREKRLALQARIRRENPEAVKERRRRYAVENKDAIAERKRAYRAQNIDRLRQADRDRRQANKAEISAKHVELRRRKREADPLFAMKHRVRALLGQSLKGYGGKAGSKTEAMLGCSWPEFKLHIERQFLPGMSWGNRAEWHLDHIVSLSTAKTREEVIALNHFTNLRPLPAKDNILKGDAPHFLI